MVRGENLKKYFFINQGIFKPKTVIKAVDDVSFEIERGKIFAIVGESGSGKSTIAKLILKLYQPTSGRIYIDGKDILSMPKKEFRKFRRHIQIVFQDPYGSLNPKLRIMSILREPFKAHNIGTKKEQIDFVFSLLELVGLKKEDAYKYPYEFSGGQRQRICIARAIALKPKLLVLDEPISNLDVSIQSQILHLLKELQEKYNLTYIFISHDLAIVKYIADFVGIFYLGKLVELAPKDEIFSNPLHPYTKLLLSSALSIKKKTLHKIKKIQDESLHIQYNNRCYFYNRCNSKKPICEKNPHPKLKLIDDTSKRHYVACYVV